MKPELEEHGIAVGIAAQPLLRRMVEIEEDAWWAIYGSEAEPDAVIFAAHGDEAKQFLAWLRTRTDMGGAVLNDLAAEKAVR